MLKCSNTVTYTFLDKALKVTSNHHMKLKFIYGI